MNEGAWSSGAGALQMGLKCSNMDPGSADSKWGPATTRAVLTLQRAKRIAADGVYGPNTHNAVDGWSPSITDGTHRCWGDPAI
ncbi:MAG: peptidoglycan-binding protein [Propionibacteriaceae bacterium]|nr:peptidoglycan-binding protein [Propionibacteriaceae bacterium]